MSNFCANPDIDVEPSDRARAQAERLIAAELPSEYQTTLHPSIPALAEPQFSPLIQQELERKAAGQPLTGGIDLTRYEAPEPPSAESGPDADPAAKLDAWRQTLQKAYTASSHLTTRHENLTLLEENGRNAWLIGNSQLEVVLRDLEKELAETTAAIESVNKERKLAQEAKKGELAGLQDTWRRGVGAVLETELAAESLHRLILERRRQLAQQQQQQ